MMKLRLRGITAYRIYWDTVVGDEIESSAEITSPLQTSYTIEGLKPGTSYQISVAAVNRDGEAARSETLEVQTLPLPAPANLIAHAVTVDGIRVSWTAPVEDDETLIMGITGYAVYWREAPSGTEIREDITDSLQTSYVIRELTTGRMYAVTVAAVAGTHTGLRTAPLVIGLTATAAQPTTARPTLAAGSNHNCVIVDGTAKCWGSNADGPRRGQLGDGDRHASQNSPVDVVDLEFGVTSIAAGAVNSCAIQNGAAKCWGGNVRSQLGFPPAGSSNAEREETRPVQVPGLTVGVTAISIGNLHICAVQYGAAKCWGRPENNVDVLDDNLQLTTRLAQGILGGSGARRWYTDISRRFGFWRDGDCGRILLFLCDSERSSEMLGCEW